MPFNPTLMDATGFKSGWMAPTNTDVCAGKLATDTEYGGQQMS